MARLLVLKSAGASRTMQAGDVVTVQPDGHVWGSGELEWPFTTIDLPGVPVAELLPLLDEVSKDGRQVLFRRVGLNLLALGPSPSFADVMSARVEKTQIPLLT